MVPKSELGRIYRIIHNLMEKEDYITIDFICKHTNLSSFDDFDHIDISLSLLTATTPIKTAHPFINDEKL